MVFRENYFDKAHTDRLKGIAAVLIVIHHLYQQTAVTTHWGPLSEKEEFTLVLALG